MPTRTSNYRKWKDMSKHEKLVWFGKLAVSILTFGFAFPHVMEPHLIDG